MTEHTCRNGGVVRIPKTWCALCMRAERNELLLACEFLLTKCREKDVMDGADEEEYLAVHAAIAKVKDLSSPENKEPQ